MIDIKDFFFGGGTNTKQTAQPIKDFAEKPMDLIAEILPNAYIIAGLILFIYLIIGGFTLISAGSDSKKTDEGKQAVTNAIIGFVVIFASYWIIQIIEIITGIPIVKGS
jgi:hypothetical protein